MMLSNDTLKKTLNMNDLGKLPISKIFFNLEIASFDAVFSYIFLFEGVYYNSMSCQGKSIYNGSEKLIRKAIRFI